MIEITTIVVVDRRCADQLEMVWPTWRLHRPELFSQPLVIICDWAAGNKRFWKRRLRFMGHHADRRIVGWDWPRLDDTQFSGMTQRERMLTAWVKVPPAVVQTPYFVKIDTDVVATKTCPWILPEWFDDRPALIASPWGYTKPATYPGILDEWATTIPTLAPLRSLALPAPQTDQGTIRHKRIASWCCFVNTTFAQTAADYVPGRLPVPSQDTYHWYVAWRESQPIVKAKMKNYGWTCVNGDRRRQRLVEEVLQLDKEHCCD